MHMYVANAKTMWKVGSARVAPISARQRLVVFTKYSSEDFNVTMWLTCKLSCYLKRQCSRCEICVSLTHWSVVIQKLFFPSSLQYSQQISFAQLARLSARHTDQPWIRRGCHLPDVIWVIVHECNSRLTFGLQICRKWAPLCCICRGIRHGV